MRPFILCVLLSLALVSAELPDPTKDLSGRSLIANLAKLRTEVAATPKDPAVWAAVTRTYAMLALQTEPDMWGAYGPWWDYAHRARTTLDGLRPGEPATLDEALPGLWVDLLDRDARRVVATLDRLAPSSTHAEAKALRALALGNRDEAKGSAPLLKFAHSTTTLYSFNWLPHVAIPRGQDPWSFGMLHLNQPRLITPQRTDELLPAILLSVCADTIWMLQSSELDDEIAGTLLRKFLIATTSGQSAGGSRQALITAAMGNLQHIDLQQDGLRLFLASWQACQAGLGGKQGWKGNMPEGLVGLGDIARWNRDRHEIWLRQLLHESPTPQSSTAIESIQAETGLIIPFRYSQGVSRSADYLAALPDAIRSELARPESHRFSKPLLINALEWIVSCDPALGASILDVAMPLLDDTDPRGLASWTSLCINAGRSDLGIRRAAARYAQDPWNSQSFWSWALVNPDEPLLAISATPASATWHASGIDTTQAERIHSEQGKEFAVRWRGSLSLPATGAWLISFRSDETARLAVGASRFDCDGGQSTRTQVIVSRGPAEAIPISIECTSMYTNLDCQLRWKGPDDSEFSIIPESALSADGRPGLRADLFNFANDDKLRLALARPMLASFARRAPWSTVIYETYAYDVYRAQQWTAAAEAFTLISRLRSTNGEEYAIGVRSLCYLMQDPPNSASAAALLRLGQGFYLCPSPFEILLARCATYPGLAQEMLPLLASRPRGEVLATVAANSSGGGKFITDGELIRLHFSLAAGDLEQALAAGHMIVRYRDNGSARSEWLKEAIILEALLSRILIPQWTPSPELTAQVKFRIPSNAMYESLANWLTGEEDWNQVIEASPDQLNAYALAYYRALYLLTMKDFEAAKTALLACTTSIPASDVHHHFAKGALAWLAQQSNADLQSLPKALPLRMGSPGNPTGVNDGSNF